MDYLNELWGSGTNLNVLQMGVRGLSVFLIALLLIRISGRRSFGIRTPLDNIIVILLGAILSRAVVGASPFLPAIATSLIIVLMHRLFGWIIFRNPKFGVVVEGEKLSLFNGGKFIRAEMEKALVCEEDIRQGVRESCQMNDLEKISEIFMERNGEISVITKS